MLKAIMRYFLTVAKGTGCYAGDTESSVVICIAAHACIMSHHMRCSRVIQLVPRLSSTAIV